MGFYEEISFIIETFDWEMFCCHLDDVYPQLVREFYSHLTIDSSFVYVKGILILFHEYTIKSFYDFDNVVDECDALINALSNDRLNEVL